MRGSKGLEYFHKLESLEGRKFAPLETAIKLLAKLGNPQEKVKSIHVAGTNGKGTVCSLLSAMLYAEGYSVGQSCSPHLMNVNERCLINGKPQNFQEFGEAIEAVVEICEEENLVPSYFVLGVVASFYEFARLGLDWMVIEVGLGGEQDATNLMTSPQASVITNISLDHTEILGKTEIEISRSKAGIAKKDVPLFVGEVSPEVRAEVARIALERKAVPFFYNQEFSYHQETSEIEIVGKAKLQLELGKLFLSGKHQKRNAILASSVANYLGLSSSSINKGLQIARWPGRLEYVDNRNGLFLLDVAHNPGGIEVLNDYILEEVIKKYKDISFMISILSRKDWKGMLDLLSKLKSALATKDIKANFIFTNSDHYQSADPKMLQEYFGSGEIAESCDKGLELAAKTNSELVIVTGSLFLVGKVRPMIGVEGYCSIEG